MDITLAELRRFFDLNGGMSIYVDARVHRQYIIAKSATLLF